MFDAGETEEKTHRRETTAEMLSRIGKQFHIGREEDEKEVFIEDINVDLNEDELNPLPVSVKLQFDSESPEYKPGSAENSVKDNEDNLKNYVSEVDNLWSLCVERAKLDSDTEDSAPEAAKPDHEAAATQKVLDNPFLKRILDSHPSAPPTVRCEPEQFLLYSMLLGNYKIHTKVVSDYALRQQLYWYERQADSK